MWLRRDTPGACWPVDLGDGEKTTEATHLRLSGIGSYDLDTGARQWYVDPAALAGDGGQHLVNDLYLAPDGTAYEQVLCPVMDRAAWHLALMPGCLVTCGVGGRRSSRSPGARVRGGEGG
jgi:hypothetical protein